MATLRQHGTTLIAGLIVLGVIGLLGGSTSALFDPNRVIRGAVWFVGAFLAAQIAKRMLVDLETSALSAAAIVMILLALGIEQRRDNEPIEPQVLLQLGLTLIGTVAGAVTARRHVEVHPVFAILGAGAASFGAAVLGVGIAILLDRDAGSGVGLLIGAPVGAALVVSTVAIPRSYAATGLMLFLALILMATSKSIGEAMAMGLAGVVVGMVLGGIGGVIGAKLRPSQKKLDLPQARQVD